MVCCKAWGTWWWVLQCCLCGCQAWIGLEGEPSPWLVGIRRCSVKAPALQRMWASTTSSSTFSCPIGMTGLGCQTCLFSGLLWGHLKRVRSLVGCTASVSRSFMVVDQCCWMCGLSYASGAGAQQSGKMRWMRVAVVSTEVWEDSLPRGLQAPQEKLVHVSCQAGLCLHGCSWGCSESLDWCLGLFMVMHPGIQLPTAWIDLGDGGAGGAVEKIASFSGCSTW